MSEENAEFAMPSRRLLIQAHNEQRAMERYGVQLSENDAAHMSAQCRDQRGTFLARKQDSKNVKVWLVWWPSANRIVPVYYDNKRKSIVSVLPLQAAERIVRSMSPPPVNAALEQPHLAIEDPA